jgi:hypothetical protein
MKTALLRCAEWNQDYLGKTRKEALIWINITGSAKIRAEDVTMGESFTWTTDSGDAIELLGVNNEGLPIYSGGKLNHEQKARWKRITG